MDLTEMLDLLVIDLKMTLGSEISVAEGTRAINKAVDELSRHIPRERIYDYTWVKDVTDNSFTTPATEDPDYIVDNMDLPNTVVDGSTATLTATLWLDVPRPVTFTLTDGNNSITRMTLVVKGTDADGVYREERFYRHNGKVQTGKVYFSSIYEIEFSEITGNVTGDILDVGTAEPDLATGGIWVQLANPVEPGIEGIYSAALKAGTKYILNTDYEMDYANGRIRMMNGGSLADGTTYYANYSRASTSIDISSVIPQLIRIVKVLYPAKEVPEQQVGFSIWENMLTIGSLRQGVSQETLTDKAHIAVYYEARHAPPTLVSDGSYPSVLDEVVILGATGHALLMEALEYELQAVTDLASARTELAKSAVLVTASTGKIDLALTKVALYLETNDTTDNAKDVLANITDDVGELRTKIITAQDAIATYLGAVSTTDLDAATVGAVAWLLEGELLINKLNDGGPTVPERFADYAKTKIQISHARIQSALGYAQEAQIRLTNLQTYISEAGGWMRMGEIFVGEAQTWIAEVNAIIAEAAKYQESAGLSLILADRFRAEAQSRLNEFRTVLASKSEYRKKVVSVAVRQPG